MLREIIEIDEQRCVGCGNCVPNCHQGALQIIDGKARLISDLMCEGIGVCVGHCPTGAMTIEKREAEPYDEGRVMQKICAGGCNVVRAHLEHLERHRQTGYLQQALAYLRENNMEDPRMTGSTNNRPNEKSARVGDAAAAPGNTAEYADERLHGEGCPGAMARSLGGRSTAARSGTNVGSARDAGGPAASELRQWPVQLHLLNPAAPYFQNADVLLAADCTAFAMGAFHQHLLRGKALAIACPKLDQGRDHYIDKLTRMIDESNINTLTVAMMEVPCCGGLLQIARAAVAQAERPIPIKQIIISLEGEILDQSWIM